VKILRVYSRHGCHLCEQLVEELLPLARGRLQVEVVDIDDNSDWKEAFGSCIPVVTFEGEVVCQYALDRDAIGRILAGIAAPPG
jgi:predicted thioredoxin/glutaredoxin